MSSVYANHQNSPSSDFHLEQLGEEELDEVFSLTSCNSAIHTFTITFSHDDDQLLRAPGIANVLGQMFATENAFTIHVQNHGPVVAHNLVLQYTVTGKYVGQSTRTVAIGSVNVNGVLSQTFHYAGWETLQFTVTGFNAHPHVSNLLRNPFVGLGR